jgi:hypothetical protein
MTDVAIVVGHPAGILMADVVAGAKATDPYAIYADSGRTQKLDVDPDPDPGSCTHLTK